MFNKFLKCNVCNFNRLWHRKYQVLANSGAWDTSLLYSQDIGKVIESHWKDKLHQHDNEMQQKVDPQNSCYVLSMFPYPSGHLHMGHVRVYTISDVMARYYRLKGKSVIHPMGWDAFGLPAENAAIERGEQADVWTKSNIKLMKKQLQAMSFCFDWNRELSTCDPDYYRWTQYIFLKMYDANLVYQKLGEVNWDPVDETVLADEQVSPEGLSWRSGAKVERRFLKQWYIKTTAYHQSLLDGLKEVDPQLWYDVIDLQKHWIGEITGCTLDFKLKSPVPLHTDLLDSFTKSPHGLYGVTHILISPEHHLNKPEFYKKRSEENHSSTTVQELDIDAIHPLTDKPIPIYVHNDYAFATQSKTHVGIPSLSEDDTLFCKEHNLIASTIIEDNILINSEQFNGLETKAAHQAICSKLKELKAGGHMTSEQGRDWLISRQRYWGTPIPMMNCSKKGTVPVPYDQLPVVLPEIKQRSRKGTSPLQNAPAEWLNIKCDGCDCNSFATRETDTMDTFVDSSWYFLRYLDAKNTKSMFAKDKVEDGLPVDLYIGGKEHAIMHLYYARFFTHFLHHSGVIPVKEPFKRLLTQGMVLGKTYRQPSNDLKYLKPQEISFTDNDGKKVAVHAETGEKLHTEWDKMSKSKYNGVDPQDIINKYGVDSTRLCIMYGVAPVSDRKWSDDDFVSVDRFKGRIWQLVSRYIKSHGSSDNSMVSCESARHQFNHDQQLKDSRNQALLDVEFVMEKSLYISVAVTNIQILCNTLMKFPSELIATSSEFERTLADVLIMMFPFTPMFCAECWTGLQSVPTKLVDKSLNWKQMVYDQHWPTVDSDYKIPLRVKSGNRTLYNIPLPMDRDSMDTLTTEQAEKLAMDTELYEMHIGKDAVILNTQINVVPRYRAEIQFTIKGKKARKKTTKKFDAHKVV